MWRIPCLLNFPLATHCVNANLAQCVTLVGETMDLLTQARSIMAMSLSFHIVFASISMTMPLLMVLAEYRWLRAGRLTDLKLAKRWQTATAILFALEHSQGRFLL